MPVIRNIQPRKIVTARLASGGSDHRGEAEHRKHDAFEQKGLPMRLHRGAHFGLQFADVVEFMSWGTVMAALPVYAGAILERFRAKWKAVRVNKTRQSNRNGRLSLTGADEKPAAPVRIRLRPRI